MTRILQMRPNKRMKADGQTASLFFPRLIRSVSWQF
jgi:hypothetical protein